MLKSLPLFRLFIKNWNKMGQGCRRPLNGKVRWVLPLRVW